MAPISITDLLADVLAACNPRVPAPLGFETPWDHIPAGTTDVAVSPCDVVLGFAGGSHGNA